MLRTPNSSANGILKRTLGHTGSKYFYHHRFRLQVLDNQSSSRRAFKPAQEQEVAEDWRRPRNQTELAACCRDFGTKPERESEGREVILGTALKLFSVSEIQATSQWKKSTREHGAETRKEKRGTEVQ